MADKDIAAAVLETTAVAFTILGFGVLFVLSIGTVVTTSMVTANTITRHSSAEEEVLKSGEINGTQVFTVLVSLIALGLTFIFTVASDTGLHPALTIVICAGAVLVLHGSTMMILWLWSKSMSAPMRSSEKNIGEKKE